jgi:hypothetical protein
MAWKLGTLVSSAIKTKRIDHIIAACPFTRELWHHILQALGLQLPAGTASSLAWWRRLLSLANGQRRKGLDTLFAFSWQVWKERNARSETPAHQDGGRPMRKWEFCPHEERDAIKFVASWVSPESPNERCASLYFVISRFLATL